MLNPAIGKLINNSESRYHPDSCSVAFVNPAGGAAQFKIREAKDQTLFQLVSQPSPTTSGFQISVCSCCPKDHHKTHYGSRYVSHPPSTSV